MTNTGALTAGNPFGVYKQGVAGPLQAAITRLAIT